MTEKIIAVLKGNDRYDGLEITLGHLFPQVCTPGPMPGFASYTSQDESVPLAPVSTLYWRLVIAEDGMPSRDDQGRYRYELT